MSDKKFGNRKIIWIVAGSIIGLVTLVVLLGLYFSGKIEEQIRQSVTAYEEIDIDLLQQNVHVKGLEVEQGAGTLIASEVSLHGLNYWNYLVNDHLIIDKVEVRSPEITLFKKTEAGKDSGKNFGRKILIRDFRASNGIFRLKKRDSSGNEVFLRFPEMGLSQIKVDSSVKKNTLPFEYAGFHLKSDSVAVNMNPQHFIAAEEFTIQNGKTSIKNFKIQPYFEREEFDKKIPHEKDRISLGVEKIELDSLQFSFKNDTLHLKNPLLTLAGADLDIYRNKLLPDDQRTKTLLSQKMRNSPVKFDFEEIKVNNSAIRYEEKLNEKGPPAIVYFSKIEVSVENFINTHLERKDFPRTSITANALFMDSASVKMEWSFNATNMNDKFLISGNFGTIPGELLNPLLKPSMGIEAKGRLESVSFTFTGNDEVGKGDVKVVYDRFKINLMQKEGRKKNDLLSALANLFVDNNGLSEERTHSVHFTRDNTKSFWNYIWTGLKKGVIDALVQL